VGLGRSRELNRKLGAWCFGREVENNRNFGSRQFITGAWPSGALGTNKVLMRAGFIYPWPRLTDYLYEK
jgi:hypothetical protein